MSILKAIWDRLGDSSPSTRGGFGSFLPPWNRSYISRYILDYSSRISALGLDRPPTLSLAGRTFTFVEGHWEVSGPEGGSSKSRSRLRQRRRALEEENRALKLRQETLMELLTEASARLEVLREERRAATRPTPKKITVAPQ